MKFTLGELEELFFKIQNIIGYFEEKPYYEENSAVIFLSNGDKLEYRMNKGNIAHLLGINIEYLKATKTFVGSNSYELLRELIDNPYKVYNLEKEGVLSYNQLFSPYINDKIKIFNFNTRLNIYDTEFVCKYDVKKTYALTEKNEKFDYIIIKKDKYNSSYVVLCLKKSGNYYVPMSSIFIKDYDELKEKIKHLIENQEVTIFNGLRFDYSKSFVLPLDIKISKLTNLEKYKNEFNCIIDTTTDFKYHLTSSLKYKNQHFSDYDLIQNAIISISNGNLIDVEQFVNSNLIGLINAYNDFLCSCNFEDRTEVNETYSSIEKERKELKEELIRLKELVEVLKKEKQSCLEDNNKLKKENDKHIADKETIMKILSPSI